MSVLIALLVLALAVLAFVMIADKVSGGKTMRFDDWAVMCWLVARQLQHRGAVEREAVDAK